MKLKDLIFEQDNQVAAAAKAINDAIISIDDSMHYGVFAKAVAHILKDEYGSHNFTPFMEVLHKELGISEQADSSNLESSLKKELEKDFSKYSPFIQTGSYDQNRTDGDPLKGKGFVKITFRHKDSLPEEEWSKLEKLVKSHGGTITDSANWYDMEPGERDYYPTLKFNFTL